jgi:hypothetical protein
MGINSRLDITEENSLERTVELTKESQTGEWPAIERYHPNSTLCLHLWLSSAYY